MRPRGLSRSWLCVYTAQGFEFDYVGVIFGKDLVYRPEQKWIGQKQESSDSQSRSGRKIGFSN